MNLYDKNVHQLTRMSFNTYTWYKHAMPAEIASYLGSSTEPGYEAKQKYVKV